MEYDGAIGTTGFAVVRAREEYILPEYLHIILSSKFIKEQFEKRMSGSNYPAISRPELELIEIPVPSFSIQEQVIETIKRIKRDKKQKSQQIDELKAMIETLNIEIENGIDLLLKKQIETRHDGES